MLRDEKWIRDNVDMYTGMVQVPATELVKLLREHAELQKKFDEMDRKYTDKLWEKG